MRSEKAIYEILLSSVSPLSISISLFSSIHIKMLAVLHQQLPHMGFGYKPKTTLLGRAIHNNNNNNNNNTKKRRREDVAIHIEESKRVKTTITSHHPELSVIKTPSIPSSTESLRLAITRAQKALLKNKREAAKASLQAMEKEVDIDDNLETFKQLRMICGGREVVMGSFKLPRFGVELVLKKDEDED